MSEEKIKKVLKAFVINEFSRFGSSGFPVEFYKDLNDLERAEVIKRFKAAKKERGAS